MSVRDAGKEPVILVQFTDSKGWFLMHRAILGLLLVGMSALPPLMGIAWRTAPPEA